MAFITLITAMIITEISLIGDRSLEDEKTDGKPMNVVVIGVDLHCRQCVRMLRRFYYAVFGSVCT